MQNVKDMKEVEPGIFVPTKTSYLVDVDKWCKDNLDYNLTINRLTREILVAYKYGEVDGIAYAKRHFQVPLFHVGCTHSYASNQLGGLFL